MRPDEIKKLREATGLNQTKFAQLFGVSTATVAYWEKGERNPQPIYQASMMSLKDKMAQSKNSETTIETLGNFLLVGGMVAFLIWVFSDNKKK